MQPLPVPQYGYFGDVLLSLAIEVVFAYPFHFGKSGFFAYFLALNPDIRILSGFFAVLYRPLHIV